MTLRYLGLGIFIATTQERNNQEINSGLCISQMPIFSFKCGLESRITNQLLYGYDVNNISKGRAEEMKSKQIQKYQIIV